jgi:hypothetical protein
VRKSEVSTNELGGTASQFLREFQRNGPTVVLCRIPEVAHTTVVLVSPKCTLQCGVRPYPRFAAGLRGYTYTSLVPDEGFYQAFIESFRQAGIDRDRIPRALFSAYAGYGAYGKANKLPAVGSRSLLGLALDMRVESSFVPDDKVSAVISHWERQIRMFGEESFAVVDSATEAMIGDPARGIDGSSERFASTSEDYWALFANAFPNTEIESLAIKRLQFLVDELRAGRPIVPNLFVGHWVKRSPSLWIKPRSTDPNTWARLELRSEVLKRLSKVWHYSAAVSFLDDLTERFDSEAEVNAEILNRSVSNVRQYIVNVESRFPVILEDPME